MRFAALIILVVVAAEVAGAVPITSGLIGYWPADGNGADQSGFGRDLTLNGGLGFSAGLVGQATPRAPKDFSRCTVALE